MTRNIYNHIAASDNLGIKKIEMLQVSCFFIILTVMAACHPSEPLQVLRIKLTSNLKISYPCSVCFLYQTGQGSSTLDIHLYLLCNQIVGGLSSKATQQQ